MKIDEIKQYAKSTIANFCGCNECDNQRTILKLCAALKLAIKQRDVFGDCYYADIEEFVPSKFQRENEEIEKILRGEG